MKYFHLCVREVREVALIYFTEIIQWKKKKNVRKKYFKLREEKNFLILYKLGMELYTIGWRADTMRVVTVG